MERTTCRPIYDLIHLASFSDSGISQREKDEETYFEKKDQKLVSSQVFNPVVYFTFIHTSTVYKTIITTMLLSKIPGWQVKWLFCLSVYP
jgi:hypothetical protein